MIRTIWPKLWYSLALAISVSWSFARSPKSPNTNPLRHGSLTQTTIPLSSFFLAFPAMNSNSSKQDLAMTGSIIWPNLRTNSRMKILSSAWAWVIIYGTGVHLSCGKTFFGGLTMSSTLVLAKFWTCSFSDFAVLGAPGTLERDPRGLEKGECLS